MTTCNKTGDCVNPIKYQCCHGCLKVHPTIDKANGRWHWLPDTGCDLGEDRPPVCKEHKCEWAKAQTGVKNG